VSADITALDELDAHHTGEAEFLIDANGNPLHVETVFAYRLDGEDPRDFFARAKAEGLWQPGDRVRVPRHGHYDLVRIVRPAKKT